MLSLRWTTAAGVLAACLVLAPSVARAQSVTAASPGSFPARLIGGGAQTPRQSPFDANGVSYSDCMAGMTLRFTLAVASFQAGQQLQVWGSVQPIDCTQTGARTSSPPTCWPLSPPYDSPSDGSATYDVQVQDLVGYQKATPTTTYAALDSTACLAQAGQDAVPMYIWFMPIDSSSGNVVGLATLYQYAIVTDLVGPAPPTAQLLTVADTALTATWTPNSDSDTLGYDVYMDPPLTGADDGGPFVECPETGDQECYTVTPGGGVSADGGVTCSSTLTDFQSILASPGSTSTSTDAQVEASTTTTDAGVVSTVGAGIGGVPPKYLVTTPGSALSVLGKGNGSLQVPGLTDDTYYGFVISAVDSEGNIGPPSGQECDFPDKTTDFFQTYKGDGGAAGGGCALESRSASGGAAAATGVALLLATSAWRRRRKAP